MAAIERISITVPAEMAAAVRRTVEVGEYASTSEVIREALREWIGRRGGRPRNLEWLREAVRIGDEGGPGTPADKVFVQLRRLISEHALTG